MPLRSPAGPEVAHPLRGMLICRADGERKEVLGGEACCSHLGKVVARVTELWVKHSQLKFQKTLFICLQTPFSMPETAEGQLADVLSCCTLLRESGVHDCVTSMDTCGPAVSCWKRPPSPEAPDQVGEASPGKHFPVAQPRAAAGSSCS